ncbi:hypothetical protein [Spiroplasma phoeniceum]|uniref:hypothetical protein n=1 Tax=Spiroplasma phoeniceum TaxID=47835 RepID=UPI003364EA7D
MKKKKIIFERSWFFNGKNIILFCGPLVTKYGKDNVINAVNKIVTNNVKENE